MGPRRQERFRQSWRSFFLQTICGQGEEGSAPGFGWTQVGAIPGGSRLMPRHQNPQAMRAVSQRLEFTGDDRLGHQADPDTWLTPRYILDQLGAFDLDPCSAEQTPNWTEAKLCLTKMEDGLALRWRGRVFMNPPFSQT